MDKQKTSVFSEYQNNQNDSATSKQVEYWLSQIAPPKKQPKLGLEWTLMSSNSVYEDGDPHLTRNETYDSLKQNNMNLVNMFRNNSSCTRDPSKSKSYVGAMQVLQKKNKNLEQQVERLKRTVHFLNEERSKSIGQSSSIAQELRNRIEILQPKTQKIQQLIKQNKRLRNLKDEDAKRMKIMEKNHQQMSLKLANKQKQNQNLQKEKQQLQILLQKERLQFEKLSKDVDSVKERNYLLQEMKQKSTQVLLEKYNKSIEMVEKLSNQNCALNKQYTFIKGRQVEILKERDETYRKEKEQLHIKIQKLIQENQEKKDCIEGLRRQIAYFKEMYQRKDEELIDTLRNNKTQIIHINHQVRKNNKAESKHEKSQNQIEKESFIKPINKKKDQIESRYELDLENQSSLEEQSEHECLSVCKKINKIAKDKQVLASSRNASKPNKDQSFKSKTKNKYTKSDKEYSKSKSKEKQMEKSKEKSKIKQIQKDIQRSKQKIFNQRMNILNKQNNNLMNSYEPVTQQEFPSVNRHYYIEQEGINCNSAHQNRSRNLYYWQNQTANQVKQFCSGMHQKTDQKPLELAMLVQVQKEAIRLYEQQQNLLNLSNQAVSQCQRAEYIGRLKQLNEQIKVNSQKMMELKSK